MVGVRLIVRKHRAPKGALRLVGGDDSLRGDGGGQKAPSTKGALRPRYFDLVGQPDDQPESTERQKVH